METGAFTETYWTTETLKEEVKTNDCPCEKRLF